MKLPEATKVLNEYLKTRSYIVGFQPSQADVTVISNIQDKPSQDTPYLFRWYNHIKSFNEAEQKKFLIKTVEPSVVELLDSVGLYKQAAPKGKQSTPKKEEKKDDDDDLDLFGSDEEDEEAEKIKAERLKAYAAKKSNKPAVIAKSSIVLDVKPWDDETDMAEMEKNVRTIVMDGLVWGASKLVPVGYGIKKLQIMCVVEDEKVSVDDLVEKIQDFEDFVQSVDIAAFNKI